MRVNRQFLEVGVIGDVELGKSLHEFAWDDVAPIVPRVGGGRKSDMVAFFQAVFYQRADGVTEYAAADDLCVHNVMSLVDPEHGVLEQIESILLLELLEGVRQGRVGSDQDAVANG